MQPSLRMPFFMFALTAEIRPSRGVCWIYKTLTISGKTLFNMKATHGLPLDFALDIIKDADCVVDWIGFIDTARKNKWWDFQTLPVIAQCTSDAGYTQEEQDAIITRLKIYVTNNEHPELK